MNEIKLGTIGSGKIVRSILDGVQKTDGISLEAVYSRKEETGRALAESYGAQKVYTDMDAFLADEAVNFVYVASPNILHYEQTKKALLAGKNVICEKPFCTQASLARELVDLAKEKGLYLIDATPTAFLPNFQVMKRELHKVGKVKLVMGNYSQYSSRYDNVLAGESPNIFNPAFAGGCLMDINFYNVWINVALFGKPESVTYYCNQHERLADTSGVLVMQYPGFVAECVGAKDTWGVNYYQIEGESGYIYAKEGCNKLVEIDVVTKQSGETFNEQEDTDRWYYEVSEITRLVLEGKHEEIDAGLEIMVTVMEIIENARKHVGIFFPGDSEYSEI